MSIQDNLQSILDAPGNGVGLDIVIVSTTTARQADYWQQRLTAGRGQVCHTNALILTVVEDWPGGAGNGLGTLYALAKASEAAHRIHDRDLMVELRSGAAVGLYHTAGKGTRLAPLPGSEGNNKPAVKLPGSVVIDGNTEAITILEAVIRQTAIYTTGRSGRVGVFWGDQVFIPSVIPPTKATHEIDILAKLGPMPDAARWDRDGLHNYGLITVAKNGDAAQIEKVDHGVASELIGNGVINVEGGIGVSLGSFSMSSAMTTALLAEFETELEEKTIKLDTDPHFWMPLTLDAETYRAMMAAKGIDTSDSDSHFHRMKSFLARFISSHPGTRIFSCIDVGSACWWWDYGTIDGYMTNSLKLLGTNTEAKGMRLFFDVELNNGNVLVDCDADELNATKSILVGVRADAIECTGSVLMSVQCSRINGSDLLLYNVTEAAELDLESGTVRADALLPGQGSLAFWTHRDRDGKQDWNDVLEGNSLSYDELHIQNASADSKES
jgi:hypothetical protein